MPLRPAAPPPARRPASRREFLRTGAAATAVLAAAAPPRLGAADSASAALIRELIRAHDARLPGLLAKQERRAGHPRIGAVPNEHGLDTAYGPAGLISAIATAVASPGGRHHRDPALAAPLQLAIRALLAAQHDDGTIDLYSTNFRSPPDTAFILEDMVPAAALLHATGVPEFAAAAEELGRFLRRGAEALVTGGVHTPNHRWVVCAALALVHSLYPDDRYIDRVDQWLAEGIDLDPDGQYTEKSTSVYSPVVDRALITVARLLRRPELYEPVRRNLEMTLHYVHPDGEVVTEASRRQDRYQRGSMARYYYSYRYLALLDGNGRFAAMARQIERTARSRLSDLPAFLHDPEFARALPPDSPLPTDYAKVFAHSALARIRRGAVSGTILADNPTFFSFRHGAAALEAVRLASAFFGKGQFTGAALEVRQGSYLLRQSLDGPYFQPLPSAQLATGVHRRTAYDGTLAPGSKALRTRSNVQTLEAEVAITEQAGRFTLDFVLQGTSGVPVAVELAFRRGGTLTGVEPAPGVADAFLLRAGTGRYALGGDVIEFGPGQAEHTYTQLRGALPKWDGLSVYLTGLTPFRSTLRIGQSLFP